AYVELAEQGVDGADVVEAHLVDQLLEDQGVVGEQVYTPLPIVEADRPRDDLLDFTCVAPADEAMVAHLAGTFFDGKRIPVLVFAAAAVHGIKAEVTMGWNLGIEARAHGFAVASELAFDFGLPLVGVRLDALVGQLFVDLEGGVIESEFDDREVGSSR